MPVRFRPSGSRTREGPPRGGPSGNSTQRRLSAYIVLLRRHRGTLEQCSHWCGTPSVPLGETQLRVQSGMLTQRSGPSTTWLERIARFVATPRRANTDERQAVRARDRAPSRFGVESKECPNPHGDLAPLDAPNTGPRDDHNHFLLAGLHLIVLPTWRASGKLEPVDAKSLDTKFATHKPNDAVRPGTFDLVYMCDVVRDPKS